MGGAAEIRVSRLLVSRRAVRKTVAMDAATQQPQPDPVHHGRGTDVAGRMADQLGELARELQQETDFAQVLARIVAAAVALIPGTGAGSISVVEGRRSMRSYAPSSGLAATVDRLQERFGEGPCLDAIRQQRTVRVPDVGREDRWPNFAPAAAAEGAASMLCFQLYVDGGSLGALNLYGHDAHAFTAESEEVGRVVAAHAAVAFADAKRISNLEEALATRDVIGRAKGILMERHRITDQQAFLLLSTASSRTNTKLRDVAEHLVTTGKLLGTPG